MHRTPAIVLLGFALAVARPAFAEDGAGSVRLEEGGGAPGTGGDYQLRGPETLTTPEELLGAGDAEDDEGYDDEGYDDEGYDDEQEDGSEEGEHAGESEVSLELDLDEAELEPDHLAPVHPVEPPTPERLRWLLVPPYYQGLRGGDGVRLLFPFYFQRWTAEGRSELAALPFYYRSRGPDEGRAVDVAFPVVWWMRSAASRTLVVGNVWWSRGEGSAHAGVGPLIAWGHTPEMSYQIAFPLFFRFHWSSQRQFWLAGLVFNHRVEAGYRRGLFPLFWDVERHGRGRMVAFPLLWRFWDRAQGSSLTVVPPLYAQRWQDGYGFGLAPLLFVRSRAGATRATVFPLFHYRQEPTGDRTFVSPVAWYRREETTRMGGVLLYHWMRGAHSRFDGFIPFYLGGSDSRMGTSWRFVFPSIFSSTGPARRATVLFPVVWDFEERFVRRTTAVLPLAVHHRHLHQNVSTTWVLPTFQYSRRLDGWDFNVHPLLYLSSSDDRSHQVFFPVFWRFHRPGSTRTVAFPLWWDFRSGEARFQALAPLFWRSTGPDGQWTAFLNVVYASGQRQGVPYWSLNVFPVFRVGRPSPSDLDWQILLGLAGYGRRGDRRWVDVFWVPVELDRDRGASPEAAAEPAAEREAPSAGAEPAEVGHDEDIGPRPAVAVPDLQPRA